MSGVSGEERYVKYGRKKIVDSCLIANHWAVAVGKDESWTWYEIELPDGLGSIGNKRTKIVKNTGEKADSGAGYFGGEIVGKTRKTDAQIEDFIILYQRKYPDYHLLTTNCQQFAIQLIRFLTVDLYRLKHLPDAADNVRNIRGHAIAMAHNGQAFASCHAVKMDGTVGPLSGELTFLSADAEAIAGPGLGAWVNAELFKAEADLGPVVGGHLGLNVKTGAGVRGGNLDVHLLGFGGKIGADGVAVNTPFGGARACSIL